jgi:hypothetical protein
MLLLLLTASLSASAHEKQQTIAGRIVATNILESLTCLNGNGYYSVIIELEKPHKNKPNFVEMHFSQPCGHDPEWLHAKSEFKSYRLIRGDPGEIVVEEFMKGLDEEGRRTGERPAWTLLPGAEEVKLPFGEKIPSYRSADLPYAPVV